MAGVGSADCELFGVQSYSSRVIPLCRYVETNSYVGITSLCMLYGAALRVHFIGIFHAREGQLLNEENKHHNNKDVYLPYQRSEEPPVLARVICIQKTIDS